MDSQIDTFWLSLWQIEHLFWECHISQPLWSNLNNLFKENSINYVIKKKDILLRLKSGKSVSSSLCNSLILMMTYYIIILNEN